MLHAWKCNVCGFNWDRWDKEETSCPQCESENTEKNWAGYNFMCAFKQRRGSNNEIWEHGALDDPLTRIELGFGGNSSLRTTTDDQVKDLREKAIRGEDSGKLRQEVLDIRKKNTSSKWEAK